MRFPTGLEFPRGSLPQAHHSAFRRNAIGSGKQSAIGREFQSGDAIDERIRQALLDLARDPLALSLSQIGRDGNLSLACGRTLESGNSPNYNLTIAAGGKQLGIGAPRQRLHRIAVLLQLKYRKSIGG